MTIERKPMWSASHLSCEISSEIDDVSTEKDGSVNEDTSDNIAMIEEKRQGYSKDQLKKEEAKICER